MNVNKDRLIKTYFERMGLTLPEKLTPDGETLRKLHIRHTLIIPYENTDYLDGAIRSTCFEIQYHEVIEKRRGGMCIDMNPLFAELLTAMGYKVRCVPTEICWKSPDDLNFHVILTVEDCDGRGWWCDVANPFTRFYEPVCIGDGGEQYDEGVPFKLVKDASGTPLLLERKKDGWHDFLRVLDLDTGVAERDRSKFNAVSDYPGNSICTKEVFSILTPEGRRTLTGNLYRESAGNGLYQLECPAGLMPWAYAQFGLKKH